MANTDDHEPDPKSGYSVRSHDQLTTEVKVRLVTEKIEVEEIRMVFDSLADVLPKGMSLSLICIGLKLSNLYFIWKQANTLVHYTQS